MRIFWDMSAEEDLPSSSMLWSEFSALCATKANKDTTVCFLPLAASGVGDVGVGWWRLAVALLVSRGVG